MSFLPGEPVPPGFEEEMARPVVIQKQIKNFPNGPLIGTEYVVELHESGQLRPDYYCVLCNTCNDNRSIFLHWTSFGHRSNYLEAHFQKSFNTINSMRRSPNDTEDVMAATASLALAIENHFGRSLQILAVAGEDFRRFKPKICAQIRDKFHFNEHAGPHFVDVARKAMLDATPPDETLKITLKKANEPGEDDTIALDAISSDDENFGPTTVDPKKSRKQEDQQPAYRAANRSPPLGGKDIGSKIKQKLPTPKELSIQASHIAQERYLWEKFRCMMELQLKQLRDETETYESNPEKHPDYPEEWKQFWNRRYKELQEEKKCDPNRYDYKPEWIAYWKERRVELFNIAANKIKKELKEKFNLGDEDEEKTIELLERYKVRVNGGSPRSVHSRRGSRDSSPHQMTRRKANFRNNRGADAVINISDDEQSSPPRRHRIRSFGRSRSRSMSPKRARLPPRGGRRSRTRSPPYRDHRRTFRKSRSRTRSLRKRSPSPYSRDVSRGRLRHSRERGRSSTHSRSRDGFPDRVSIERDLYRSDSYARQGRNFEPVETFRVLDSRLYPEYNQPARLGSPNRASKEHELPPEPEGPLTVVSVLRMLSALEDHLGSLGPKTLNLLSKALAMEKVQANAADDLLLNEDNCVFLETVKEKLKGILIAEVLDDPQKVRVVKKLITNIAAIIFQVSSKGNTDASDGLRGELKRKRDYQLPFDRHVVSSKLASALLMNGHDDITTEDMNRLVHLFTLFAQASKARQAKKQTLCFADIAGQLGLPLQGINNELGIDEDINLLLKEVEHQLSSKDVKLSGAVEASPKAILGETSNGMESLTDSDLQTLLQNFKFLSSEEQVHLIAHLRKLELLEMPRVERLRKYVNIAELNNDNESCSDYLSRLLANSKNGDGPSTSRAIRGKSMERDLVVSAAREKANRGAEILRNTNANFMLDDDDDDDYNFDDLVMKANDNQSSTAESHSLPDEPSSNALTFKPALSKISLQDTENIIANLMGTLADAAAANNKPQNAAKALHARDGHAAMMDAQLARNPANMMKQQNQRQQQQTHHHQQQHPQHQQHPQQHHQQMQSQYGPPQHMNAMAGGAGPPHNFGNYQRNFGNEQMSAGPQYAGAQYPGNAMHHHHPQQQQQQYNMSGPGFGGGYSNMGGMSQNYAGYPAGPWGNGPAQQYNNMQ